MKYTVRLIIAALAASAALVSCTKDLAPGKSDTDSAAGTLRTVTVSFDTPTKSYLVGNQPRFSKGDSVLVSDGTALDTCAVDVDGKKTIIRTKLEGETLSAVYPYTAAVFDNYGNLVNTVKIPAIQTGKFADANICMANQSDQGNKDNLRFRNKVAILKFYADESIGVDTIRVSCAEGKIASGADTIVVTAPKVEKSQLSNPTQDPRIWYVAMHDIKDATSLTFESVTSTQGTVTKKPKPVSGDNSIEIGSIYSVFIPYYIEVKVSDSPETYQKWGYCNVGAFLPEEPGLYFAWGEVKGHKADFSIDIKEEEEMGYIPDAFSNDFKNFTFEPTRYTGTIVIDNGFSSCNTPYRNDEESSPLYKKYNGSDSALQSMDDAASANWGGKWRMPNGDEFDNLIKATNTTFVDTVNNNLKIKGTDLLFPAAGNGQGTDLQLYAKASEKKCYFGKYWTNKLKGSEYAHIFSFCAGVEIRTSDKERNNGLSIRPIYDDTISEDQPTTVTISAYSNGGTL